MDYSKQEKPLEKGGEEEEEEKKKEWQRAISGFILVSAATGLHAHMVLALGLQGHDGKNAI